jgi:ribonuclease PH
MSDAGVRPGRADSDLRPVTIETGVSEFAEGSALIAFGKTRVWCTATVENRVPAWLEGRGRGWVTAEYSMLPRATHTRTSRERATNSGRSQEISRLIGRALRAGVDQRALGERTVTVDCDVLAADGGTRTAAITGGYVALTMACRRVLLSGHIADEPIIEQIAAVSVGMVEGRLLLDLDYAEDSSADVDCNVVMTGSGALIEVQSTAERRGVSSAQFAAMLTLAAQGIDALLPVQRAAIEAAGG